MELAFTSQELRFREEVRSFVRENLSPDVAEKVRAGTPVSKQEQTAWAKKLHARGWAAPGWPREHGGTGWSAAERYIFEETLFEFDVPEMSPFGVAMVGPVLYTFGTAEQKQRFLPAILTYDEWWCQGYSEPGAGSDLASLATKAVRDGDDYIINGSKIWTSHAHFADWMFCLVRTDRSGKPQEGITFLLIDMTSPGIEISPIISIDNAHHLNLVTFIDLRVAAQNRIGDENKGWTYAKFLLGFERNNIAEVGASKRRLRKLKEMAAAEAAGDGALLEAPEFAHKLAAAEVDLKALEMTSLRYLAEEAAGREIGPEASLLKIKGTEMRQRLTELSVEAIGYYAMAIDPARRAERWNEPPIGPAYGAAQTPQYLYSRAATIYGGSNEIQRNIIAKMVLGL